MKRCGVVQIEPLVPTLVVLFTSLTASAVEKDWKEKKWEEGGRDRKEKKGRKRI